MTAHSIHINLLPWRENLRQKQYKITTIILCVMPIISILALLIWHLLLTQQKAQSAAGIIHLQKIFAPLKQQENMLKNIKKQIAMLNQQKNILEQISNRQTQNIEFLMLLSQINLALITLDSIQKDQTQITVSGKTTSLRALAKFMQKTPTLSWLETPTLQEITNNNSNNNDAQTKTFSLKMNIRNN